MQFAQIRLAAFILTAPVMPREFSTECLCNSTQNSRVALGRVVSTALMPGTPA